jgi:hypothetical protein
LSSEENRSIRRFHRNDGRTLTLPPYAKRGHCERHATQAGPLVTLYRRAFAEYGAQALWNKRMLGEPTLDDALVIARALRIEGDREARKLAEQIEKACRAAL